MRFTMKIPLVGLKENNLFISNTPWAKIVFMSYVSIRINLILLISRFWFIFILLLNDIVSPCRIPFIV